MDRDRTVQSLIADQLETFGGPQPHWLLRALENGFRDVGCGPGRRALAPRPKAEFELPVEPIDEPDDELDDDDGEIRLLWRETIAAEC